VTKKVLGPAMYARVLCKLADANSSKPYTLNARLERETAVQWTLYKYFESSLRSGDEHAGSVSK
jgi:hypothetical protein